MTGSGKSRCWQVGLLALMIAVDGVGGVDCVCAQDASKNDARLEKLLSKSPESDANGDGVLTRDEAKAFIRTQKKGAAANPATSKPERPDKASDANVPAPTHSNVAYGTHERNVFDIWIAKSSQPTPLVVCIHGGGFRGGDKSKYHKDATVARLLDAGISVATLNYRLTDGGVNPYPAQMLDCARAVQYLRAHADEYNLDKSRVAATGGSAGGCITLWLAFHDDLADPNSSDPIARESTRFMCAAPVVTPTSLEVATLNEWFETPSLIEHPALRALFALPPKGELDESSPELMAKRRAASVVTYLSTDDPPIYMTYGGADSKVDENTDPGAWVHHPRTGIKLKEKMDAMGMPAYLEYRGHKDSGPYSDSTDFLIKMLKG